MRPVLLVLSAPVYGLLQWQWGDVPYLHHMLVTFAALLVVMTLLTAWRPLPAPRELPVRHDIDMSTSPLVVVLGGLVILAVAAFFVVFR